ncbi:MAG: hypothetical protein MR292_05360 [Alistipes sp.]|nr:hypothetical protein [Alistipes sp.]
MVVIVGKTVVATGSARITGPAANAHRTSFKCTKKIRMQMPPYAKNIIPNIKAVSPRRASSPPRRYPARKAPHGMPGNIRRQKKTTGMARNVIFCIFAQI